MGPLDYCEHGAIKMTCPACRGARPLPPAVTQPMRGGVVRTAPNPMGLLPQEMQLIPDIPDEGEIGPVVLDLGAIVQKAEGLVARSSFQSNNTYRPPPIIAPVEETPAPE